MKHLDIKITAVILSCILTLSFIFSDMTVSVSAFQNALPDSVHFTDVSADTQTDSSDDTSSEDADSTEEPADITDPSAPAIVANAAIVIDAKSGQILYGKNMNKRCYPASITKVMTCLVALENVNLNDTITFSENAIWGIERDSNHISLDVGEQITAEQCFYGILLQSANEASIGMAEHVAGSVSAFADMMNQKAADLGCKDTHFVNPNGLHDDNHYTTPYDMALITQAAIQNPVFRKIDETTYYQIPPTNLQEDSRDLWHQLKMLYPTSRYYYEPIEGGKTGYTDQAHNTLVTYASKNGMELICVMMDCKGAQNCYMDSATLYDYYFDNYTYAYPLQNFDPNTTNQTNYILKNFYQGLDHDTLNLSVDKDLSIIVPRSADASAITTETTYYDTFEDNVVGKVSVLYNGEVVGESDIKYSDMTVNGEVLTWGVPPEEHQRRVNTTLIIAISCLVLVVLTLVIISRIRNRRYRYLKRRSRNSKLHF
ncbi:serine-type D-Ala-D-Ala carboxypeptidase [Clostridium sp. CAG:632]|nr:serine-type D-Ala-D-Ala carboxypeptidase [Clostridium sp. CAG:632]